jgi:hypothetical protein
MICSYTECEEIRKFSGWHRDYLEIWMAYRAGEGTQIGISALYLVG